MSDKDVPKDLPTLIPASKRPSLQELADMGAERLAPKIDRALGKTGQVKVAAFNSSI